MSDHEWFPLDIPPDEFGQFLTGSGILGHERLPDGGFRFDLTGNTRIEITHENGDLTSRFLVQRAPANGLLPPVQFYAEETTDAGQTVRKLFALAYAYNILMLMDGGDREAMMAERLRGSPYAPLDDLLDESERLYIYSVANGSFWTTVGGKFVKSYKAILSISAVIYAKGSDGLERIAESNIKTKELQAEEKELDVLLKNEALQQARVDTASKRMDFVMDTLKKAEERPEDDPVRRALTIQVSNLLGKNPDDNEAQIAYKRIVHLNEELKK